MDERTITVEPDSLDGWPTKQEAAAALGVSTKTIEKYVQQGKLTQRMQAQINKPARAVIGPNGVERMLSERSAMVLAPHSQPVLANPSQNIRESMESIVYSNWPPPLYMTEAEAVRHTGLGRGYIRSKLTPQKIGPRGAAVYRRADLESL